MLHDRQITHLIGVRLRSGTAKGGRPWRGSVKSEPGFFQVKKKTGNNPVRARKKPGKNLLEKVESTQKVGDLVMS